MIERKQVANKENEPEQRFKSSGGSGDLHVDNSSPSSKEEMLMISFDYEKQGSTEERIDLKVNNMYICVCTDFLMSIADFFLKNKPSMPASDAEKTIQAEKALTAALDTIEEEPHDVSSDETVA